WVWSDTTAWYPRLLAAGVTVERCHDLRLVHRILRHSQLVREPSAIRAAEAWDTPLAPHVPERDTGATLFDLAAGSERSRGVPRAARRVREPSAIRAAEAWDTPLAPHVPERDTGATLFDLEAGSERSGGVPQDIDEALAEFSRHRAASEGSADPGRLRLLVA